MAQAVLHAGIATVFGKHQTTSQWIQMQPREWHELQSKFLESTRLLSSVHQRTTHVNTNCCTQLLASHFPKGWLSQEAAIHHGSLVQQPGLVGMGNTLPCDNTIRMQLNKTKTRAMIQQDAASKLPMVSKKHLKGRETKAGGRCGFWSQREEVWLKIRFTPSGELAHDKAGRKSVTAAVTEQTALHVSSVLEL